MSNSSVTKTMLGEGLKKVLKSKPFSKIVVDDIAEACGVSRGTFYYHFSDKYDLLRWVFSTEVLPILSKYNKPDNWIEGYVELCKFMMKNKQFYQPLNMSGITRRNSIYWIFIPNSFPAPIL